MGLLEPNGMKGGQRVLIVVDRETGYVMDTGCQVASSCLRCPLPACRYDDGTWYKNWKREQLKLTEKKKEKAR